MSAPDTAASTLPSPETFRNFVTVADQFADQIGVPRYSDLVACIQRQAGTSTLLYGALRAVTEHAAAAETCLLRNDPAMDQEALERAAMGRGIGFATLAQAERRDVSGHGENVVLLADARLRVRGGRR